MATLATVYAVMLTAYALALRWYHRRRAERCRRCGYRCETNLNAECPEE